jgi:hypothetical protein
MVEVRDELSCRAGRAPLDSLGTCIGQSVCGAERTDVAVMVAKFNTQQEKRVAELGVQY